MGLFKFLRSIYTLDTLDVRFTSSSGAPPSAKRQVVAAGSIHEPLWNTSEFYLYYLVIGAAVPAMIKIVCSVSQPSHPNYKNYEHLLSPGWIPGRKADNSDAQYASFRDNLPFMFILVIAHPLLRHIVNSVFPTSGSSVPGASQKTKDAKSHFERRITFDRYFALVFLVALHGISAFKILFILYINFLIAHRLSREQVPIVTWIFNIVVLFANELCHGYPFKSINETIFQHAVEGNKENWLTYLDTLGGLIPRWEVLFKITILRMVSYNMDYYWSLAGGDSSSLEKKQLDPAVLSERDRVSLSADPVNYNFRTYLSYVLYSPLYIAGPIVSFNDYVSQCHYPPAHLTWGRVIKYGLRFLLALLCMEFFIHFVYAVAISKDTPNWSVYTPAQLSMLGYFSLHHIWLKLLLPWRFFRLWALADGLDPPENMVRCVSDNYSTGAFWRGWHRSFNRWIVRYIFVPLGGSGGDASKKGVFGALRSGLNLVAVFTFVAVWHDINLRLLIWSWMIVFFIAPEVLATLAFPRRKWEGSWFAYRMLCGLGAAGSIFMMMAANLVGFAVGLDGLKIIIGGILGSFDGFFFLFLASTALFVGSQVMFEIREEEFRQGIRLRC